MSYLSACCSATMIAVLSGEGRYYSCAKCDRIAVGYYKLDEKEFEDGTELQAEAKGITDTT